MLTCVRNKNNNCPQVFKWSGASAHNVRLMADNTCSSFICSAADISSDVSSDLATYTYVVAGQDAGTTLHFGCGISDHCSNGVKASVAVAADNIADACSSLECGGSCTTASGMDGVCQELAGSAKDDKELVCIASYFRSVCSEDYDNTALSLTQEYDKFETDPDLLLTDTAKELRKDLFEFAFGVPLNDYFQTARNTIDMLTTVEAQTTKFDVFLFTGCIAKEMAMQQQSPSNEHAFFPIGLYPNGGTRTNTCGEECECRSGRWVCCRERHNFYDMPTADRTLFIETYKDLSDGTGNAAGKLGTDGTTPITDEFNELIKMHRTSSSIHSLAQFLAWHRWYAVRLENLLRKVSSCVTLPYWGWEKDHASPFGSAARIWNAGDSWLGGSEGASTCINDGGFRDSEFSISPDGQSISGNTCVKRGFSTGSSGIGATPSDVAALLTRPAPQFNQFFGTLNGWHGGMHISIGGLMGSAATAQNDPIFFFHHNNVDRIWSKWQDLSTDRKEACVSMAQPLSDSDYLVGSIRTHADFYDLSNQIYGDGPGDVACVKYINPKPRLIKWDLHWIKMLAKTAFFSSEGPFFKDVKRTTKFDFTPARAWFEDLEVSTSDIDAMESSFIDYTNQPIYDSETVAASLLKQYTEMSKYDEGLENGDDQTQKLRKELFAHDVSLEIGADFSELVKQVELVQEQGAAEVASEFKAQFLNIWTNGCIAKQAPVMHDVGGQSVFLIGMWANGSTRKNTCGEECECRSGRWVCCRERRNFRDMSTAARERYIEVVKDIAEGTGAAAGMTGSDGTTSITNEFDQLVKMHRTSSSFGIHNSNQFLAWHRWYELRFENLFRKVDSCITIPYWAWEKDHNGPFEDSVSKIWQSADSWLGGSAGASSCLADGPFRWSEFDISPDGQTFIGGNTCMVRGFTPNGGSTLAFTNPTDIAALLALPASSFNTFFSQLDSDHGGVHVAIGGLMGSTITAANAPEFLMHHGNIDRIWSNWQDKSIDRKEACISMSTTLHGTNYLVGSGVNLKHEDVYDSASERYGDGPGDIACVKYIRPKFRLISVDWLHDFELREFFEPGGLFWGGVRRMRPFDFEQPKAWFDQMQQEWTDSSDNIDAGNQNTMVMVSTANKEAFDRGSNDPVVAYNHILRRNASFDAVQVRINQQAFPEADLKELEDGLLIDYEAMNDEYLEGDNTQALREAIVELEVSKAIGVRFTDLQTALTSQDNNNKEATATAEIAEHLEKQFHNLWQFGCFAKVAQQPAIGSSVFPLGFYPNGGTRTNTCGEECECRSGRWVCCRERHNFRDMSTAARQMYIQTVKDVAAGTGTAVGKVGSDGAISVTDEFNELVKMHRTSSGFNIHSRSQFLAWHRWYALRFENVLRKVNSCVTIPYWAWEKDYDGPFDTSAKIWQSGITDSWLGGSEGSSTCVADGPFQSGDFFLSPDAGGGCLRRGFTPNGGASFPWASPADIIALLARPATEFIQFFNELNGDHGGVHMAIGGVMGSAITASNAPEFLMHHGNIDRLWSKWQDKSTDRKEACDNMAQELHGTDYLYDKDVTMTHADIYDMSSQRYGNGPHDVTCAKYIEPKSRFIGVHKAFALASAKFFDNGAGPFWSHVPRLQEFNFDTAEKWFDQNSFTEGGNDAVPGNPLSGMLEGARDASKHRVTQPVAQYNNSDCPAGEEAVSGRDTRCVPVSCDSARACAFTPRKPLCESVAVKCVTSPCPQFRCIAGYASECNCGEACIIEGGGSTGVCQPDGMTCAINVQPPDCSADTSKCNCGEACIMEGGAGTGVCQPDNMTCAINVQPPDCNTNTSDSDNGSKEVSPFSDYGYGSYGWGCTLSDQTLVEIGWSGPGQGDNWCNECFCRKDGLSCTKMLCGGLAGDCLLSDETPVALGWSGPGRGDNWCNECSCTTNGLLCTRKLCEGQTGDLEYAAMRAVSKSLGVVYDALVDALDNADPGLSRVVRAEFQRILEGGCLIEGEFVADGETPATNAGCGGSCVCDYGRVVCSDSYSSMSNGTSTDMKETQGNLQHENPEKCGEEPVCCEAMISSCLACAAKMSEEEYCEQNPFTAGCTFSSLNSFARITEELHTQIDAGNTCTRKARGARIKRERARPRPFPPQ